MRPLNINIPSVSLLAAASSFVARAKRGNAWARRFSMPDAVASGKVINSLNEVREVYLEPCFTLLLQTLL